MKRLISFELFSLKNDLIDISMIIVFLTLIALKGTDYYFLFIPIMIYRNFNRKKYLNDLSKNEKFMLTFMTRKEFVFSKYFSMLFRILFLGFVFLAAVYIFQVEKFFNAAKLIIGFSSFIMTNIFVEVVYRCEDEVTKTGMGIALIIFLGSVYVVFEYIIGVIYLEKFFHVLIHFLLFLILSCVSLVKTIKEAETTDFC